MIKPEHKELKDFPISNKKSEGIHYIPADFDNITIRALYNIEYSTLSQYSCSQKTT